MKKALSILLSVMMVAGLFVALVPTASAAAVTTETAVLQMPETGLLVYTENFDDEALADKTDNALTKALGWTQYADIPDDPATPYNEAYALEGVAGTGTAAILTDESGDGSIKMAIDTDHDGYGWSTQIVNNERLVGGDYMVEFTMIINQVTNTSGFGLTIRNNTPWIHAQDSHKDEGGNYIMDPEDPTTRWYTEPETVSLKGFDKTNCTVYAMHIKRNGLYDAHYKDYGTERHLLSKVEDKANGYDNSKAYSGKDEAGNLNAIAGTNTTTAGEAGDASGVAASAASIIGCENTFRLVVDAEKGVHVFVLNQDTQGWEYYFGMDETSRTNFAENAANIGDGINFVLRKGVTLTLDDISVYTIADEENDPTVEMLGYQTAANGSNLDARFVAKVGNLAETDVVAQVRYEICVNDEFWSDVWLENAYKEITASYGAETITAEADELLTALHVTGCPAGTTFSITPYVTFADGAQLIGEAFDCTISA